MNEPRHPCRDVGDLLSAYADGELSEDDARRVESHLADCADCRAVVEAYALQDDALTGLAPARTDAEWEALAVRVDRTIEREVGDAGRADQVAARPERRGWFRPRTFAYGSGGMLVAALLIALFRPWVDETPRGPASEPASLAESAVPRPAPSPGADLERLRAEKDAPAEAGAEEAGAEDARAETPPPPLTAETLPAAEEKEAEPRKAEEAPARQSSGNASLSKAVTNLAAPRASAEAGAGSPSIASPAPLALVPPDGAPSRADALRWWEAVRPAEPSAFGSSDAARTIPATESRAKALRAAPSPERQDRDVASEDAPSSPPADVDPLVEALAWALAQQDAGHEATAQEAFRTLAGDFDDNPVREDAWAALLRIEIPSAMVTGDAAELDRVASSLEAFHEEYPDRSDVLEARARIGVRRAALRPEWCEVARASLADWRDSATDPEGPALLQTELDRICD